MNVLVREGKGSGKSISHLHYHIIPATLIGDIEHDPHGREFLTDEEATEVVVRMKKVDDKIKGAIHRKIRKV